jgi:hypothetical protein
MPVELPDVADCVLQRVVPQQAAGADMGKVHDTMA